MVPSDVDHGALFLLFLNWLLGIFVFYLAVVIILRVSNFYRVRRCPNCGGELKRANRNGGDRAIEKFSFGLLPVKRYRCYVCYWEGRAFHIKKKRKSSETGR